MTKLRLATFNVLFGHRDQGPGSWSERRLLISAAIERASPDIIGLQEVLPSRLHDVAGLLGKLTLVPGPSTGSPRAFDVSFMQDFLQGMMKGGPARGAGLGRSSSERMLAGEHMPIAFRADRFRLLGSGAFWISPTPHVRGSTLPLALSPFLVHWARFEGVDAPGPLIVLNAHFGHAPWHHRHTARIVAEQVEALVTSSLGFAPDSDGSASVFLVGDFNAWPSSPLVRALTSPAGAGFVDAARAAPERVGPRATFHWGFGFERFGLRLDYVLARGPHAPRRSEVIDLREGMLHPSDHYPVVVEFVDAA